MNRKQEIQEKKAEVAVQENEIEFRNSLLWKN